MDVLLSKCSFIDGALALKLHDRGIRTIEHLLVCSSVELTQVVGLHEQHAVELLRLVSNHVCPPVVPLSAYGETKVSTGIESLDAAMKGGVACGSITEIVGQPGLGKTQFSHQILCNSLIGDRQQGIAVYIDCEGTFSPQRVQQMLLHLRVDPQECVRVLERVHVFTCASLEQLDAVINKRLAGLASSVKLCSIFIDSISALIRHQFDDNVATRQQLLLKYAQQLKILAKNQSLPVVVTNQITGSSATGDSGSSSIAALGIMLALSVDFLSIRHITIEKSPLAAQSSFTYQITTNGVEEVMPTDP